MEMFENNKPVFSIIKGTLIAFLFTLIVLTIFSALLVYTEVSEELIKPVIITVTGISILIGSSIATKKLKKNGLLNGAIIGILYILIIYIISSILNSSFSLNLVSLIMIGIGLIGGVLGRYNWSKHKIVHLVPVLFCFFAFGAGSFLIFFIWCRFFFGQNY